MQTEQTIITGSMVDYWEKQKSEYNDPAAFMQPQLINGNQLTKEELPEGWEDWNTLPMFWARLSAPGFLDCTDWAPINDHGDIEYFFELYFM